MTVKIKIAQKGEKIRKDNLEHECMMPNIQITGVKKKRENKKTGRNQINDSRKFLSTNIMDMIYIKRIHHQHIQQCG